MYAYHFSSSKIEGGGFDLFKKVLEFRDLSWHSSSSVCSTGTVNISLESAAISLSGPTFIFSKFAFGAEKFTFLERDPPEI